MGFSVLTDQNKGRSVLFCTTVERPLDHEVFMGDDSQEQAEDFIDWLGADPRDTNSLNRKGYHDSPLGKMGAWYPALDHAISVWRRKAFNEDGDFVGRHREPADPSMPSSVWVPDGRHENDPSL